MRIPCKGSLLRKNQRSDTVFAELINNKMQTLAIVAFVSLLAAVSAVPEPKFEGVSVGGVHGQAKTPEGVIKTADTMKQDVTSYEAELWRLDNGELMDGGKLEKEELHDGIKLTATKQSSAEEYARQFNNTVVYIENYRYRGYWMSAQGKNSEIIFQPIPQSAVVAHLELKWRVKSIGQGQVTLESMKYRYSYLFVYTYTYLENNLLPRLNAMTLYSSYPQGQTYLKFKIGNRNGKFNFGIDGEYLVICCSYRARMDYNFFPLLSEFRIYTPPKSDSFEPIATLDNSARNEQWTFQYQEEIGIEQTNGQTVSETLTTELGIEIKGAFSAGMTYSKTWKSSSSETYSKKSTFTMSAIVDPHEKVQIQQLVGTYDGFKVRARYFKVLNLNQVAGTQKVAYVSGIEEYNRGEFLPEPDIIGLQQKQLATSDVKEFS